ncbi:MAG: GreA/GreB family elongation factor [Planctomycetota bacterium]
MTAHALIDLARSRQFEELERAWESSIAAPGPAEAYCAAIEALCDADMASRALAMASTMVDAMAQSGRPADARMLASTAVRRGAHNESLARRLLELTEQVFAEEAWFPLFKERSRLGSNLSPDTFEAFEALVRYTTGNVIYHRGGWGEGVVERVFPDREEISVRFASGKTMDLPLETALDSFKPLDPDDLRAMRLVDLDGLRNLAESAPSQLIRKGARMMRGKITSTQLKETLTPAVIPTSKWATFWKRARAEATVDPWLQIEGSANRPTFVLRKQPLSLTDEARRAMGFADDLGNALAICREHLSRCEDNRARETLLDMAQERLVAALRNRANVAPGQILDGLLLLEAGGRQIPDARAADALRALLFDEAGVFYPERFGQIVDGEQAVGLLEEALGPTWADLLVPNITRIPHNVVEKAVDLLEQRGHALRLLPLWDQVAPYPRRHPATTYLLGRLYASGAFDEQTERPSDIAVARVLLHLTRVLAADKRGNPTLGRLLGRVTSLLAGKKSFLGKVLEDVDRENMREWVGITERGGEDFPQEVASLVLRAVSRRFPDLDEGPTKQFWEEDFVFVTRAGLARQREEYRKLVDEKIPANSKAIGAAAALGDLSENSEWEAAMEEQRNLTGRAQEMDADLRKAKLIEEQDVTGAVVAPGTKVTFADDSGEDRQTWRVLGPWDAVEDDIVSYRAPLAKDLLGKSIDDTATIQGPHGPRQVRIEAIEKIV